MSGLQDIALTNFSYTITDTRTARKRNVLGGELPAKAQ